MNKFKIYCEVIISKPVLSRAIKVALIVGTALNIINQGENFLMLHFEQLNILKLILTYFVPYAVTTYTATAMNLEFKIGTKAVVSADLKCKKCAAIIHVEENELIPECKNCGIKTQWRLK
jgi:predicted RNA-binding Zn-ribbon protein involved in translation (DUF1610 family)